MVAFPIQVLGIPCKYRYYLETDTLFRMGSDHLRTKGFTCSTHIFLYATWDCIYILGTIILFVLANKKCDFFLKKIASFIKGLIWVSLLSLAQNELIWLWTFYFPWRLIIKNIEALGKSGNVSLLESMLSDYGHGGLSIASPQVKQSSPLSPGHPALPMWMRIATRWPSVILCRGRIVKWTACPRAALTVAYPPWEIPTNTTRSWNTNTKGHFRGHMALRRALLVMLQTPM